MNEPLKSLKVLPTTGPAGKVEELRKQTPAATPPAKKLNDETPIDWALDPSLNDEQRRIKQRVVEELQQVYDPELPVNIFDLGLIYRLDLRYAEGTEARGHEGTKGGKSGKGQIVEIDMTLTAPNCPVAEQIPRMVQEAAAKAEGVERVDVRLVWEPRWDKSRMSEVALLELGLM